ncbi:hypothetical protein [Bernardetia sp. MNP-M8]|uniref:hypothetical protein n=1 Tax=Bernardetia sp. MNP-M8 TaxID=3127470 RepID=UPI0030D0E5F4
MHIHKINPNLQEHQSFLSQNRKDPITGDSILEGDEVVFCAGCKSVFLRDTWEYLGNQHCEQKETLIEFPIYNTLHLEIEDEILFYHTSGLRSDGVDIPKLVKKSPWRTKRRILSPYQYFLTGWRHILLIVSNWILILLVAILSASFVITSIMLLPLAISMFLPLIHDSYYGSQLSSIYKNFKYNTFYLAKKTIGFSTPYGQKEYILSAEHIEQIVFYQSTGFLADNFFEIHFKNNEVYEKVKCRLPESVYKNSAQIFQALEALSMSASFTIRIKSTNEDIVYHAQKMVDEGNKNVIRTNT